MTYLFIYLFIYHKFRAQVVEVDWEKNIENCAAVSDCAKQVVDSHRKKVKDNIYWEWCFFQLPLHFLINFWLFRSNFFHSEFCFNLSLSFFFICFYLSSFLCFILFFFRSFFLFSFFLSFFHSFFFFLSFFLSFSPAPFIFEFLHFLCHFYHNSLFLFFNFYCSTLLFLFGPHVYLFLICSLLVYSFLDFLFYFFSIFIFFFFQTVKKTEIYSIRSLLQTSARKIEFYHPDSVSLKTVLELITELDVAYNTDSHLSDIIEEEEEWRFKKMKEKN